MRKIKDYVLLEEIGQGAYSQVFKCFNVNDHKQYACKQFNRIQMNRRMINNLEEEARVLRNLNCNNII